MKTNLSFLSFFFLTLSELNAQSLVTSVEAQTGVLTGVTIASDPSSSGGQYVTGFDNGGDGIEKIIKRLTSLEVYFFVIQSFSIKVLLIEVTNH